MTLATQTEDRLAKSFLWRTQTGARIAPRGMKTPHLFHSLRMIFNHTAPEKYQLRPFKRYRGIESWRPEYRRAAVMHLLNELRSRDDVTDEMKLSVILMAQSVQECYSIFTPELLN